MDRDINALINSILKVGKGMVKSGVDVRKVEESLRLMFYAYDLELVEIFVLSTVEIVTLKTKSGDYYNQIKRIERTNTDLGKYEDFNGLSRYIVREKPDYREIDRRVDYIYSYSNNPKKYDILGYVLGSGAFSIFFGGNLLDGLSSAIIGYFIYLMKLYLKGENSNRVIFTLFASIFSGILAIIFTKLGLANNIDKVMIGDIMLFIPGLAVLNAIKNMFYGDIISGMFGFIESIIVTLAIVAGFGVPSYFLGGLR